MDTLLVNTDRPGLLYRPIRSRMILDNPGEGSAPSEQEVCPHNGQESDGDG